VTDMSPGAAAPDRRSLLRNGLLVGAGAAMLAATSASMASPARRSSTKSAGTLVLVSELRATVLRRLRSGTSGYCPINFLNETTVQPPHQAPDSPTLYALTWGEPTVSGYIQEGWRYCSACKVLTWASAAVENQCPAGGYGMYHVTLSTTSVYDVYMVNPDDGYTYQPGWNYCNDCKDLYHGSGHEAGICLENSYNYYYDYGTWAD
jgi:hypothetical protein